VTDGNRKGFCNASDLSPIFNLPFFDLVSHASRNRIEIGEQTLIVLLEAEVMGVRQPQL